ncbi:hypothetical protein Tco_0949618 [Tanacetum coccineum]
MLSSSLLRKSSFSAWASSLSLSDCNRIAVLMASCILLARYVSTMPGMEETASANWKWCLFVMRGVGGGGRVVANTRGSSAIVMTETSTSEVALVLNIESIPVSGLGLSMLDTKPDDTAELCC